MTPALVGLVANQLREINCRAGYALRFAEPINERSGK